MINKHNTRTQLKHFQTNYSLYSPNILYLYSAEQSDNTKQQFAKH